MLSHSHSTLSGPRLVCLGAGSSTISEELKANKYAQVVLVPCRRRMKYDQQLLPECRTTTTMRTTMGTGAFYYVVRQLPQASLLPTDNSFLVLFVYGSE